VSDHVDLNEFVGGFVAEGEQITTDSTAWLLEIERANASGELRPKTVRDLFRALHTIKGLAGMMGVAVRFIIWRLQKRIVTRESQKC
jgi:two-component system chemotaxis sensor kinase CheA